MVTTKKSRLIYDGFVDGMINIGKEDYLPISSILLILNYAGAMPKKMKSIYMKRGRCFITTHGRPARSLIIASIRNESYAIVCCHSPQSLMGYINRWKMGEEVRDDARSWGRLGKTPSSRGRSVPSPSVTGDNADRT